MINLDLIGQISGLLSLAAYITYGIAILRGTTKPSRSTIWIALSYIIGPLIIALLSLKYGEGSRNSRSSVFPGWGFIRNLTLLYSSEK